MKISQKGLCGLLVFTGILFLLQQKTCLVIAASPSLPWKAYLVIKGMPWKKGDLVTIQGHTSPYVTGTPLITKCVAGVAGDLISERQGDLYVNDKKIGLLIRKNSRRQSLYPIENKVIYLGYIFVVGDDPRSFDSRYQEFGLVKLEHILGRSFPLW